MFNSIGFEGHLANAFDLLAHSWCRNSVRRCSLYKMSSLRHMWLRPEMSYFWSNLSRLEFLQCGVYWYFYLCKYDFIIELSTESFVVFCFKCGSRSQLFICTVGDLLLKMCFGSCLSISLGFTQFFSFQGKEMTENPLLNLMNKRCFLTCTHSNVQRKLLYRITS